MNYYPIINVLWGFVWLVFAVYVIWDLYRMWIMRRSEESGDTLLIYKNNYLAWGLKLFLLYYLITIIQIYVGTFLYFMPIVNEYLTTGSLSYTSHATFTSKEVLSDIQPTALAPGENASQITLMVVKGILPVESIRLFVYEIIYTVINAILAFSILILLWRIVQPISLMQPFVMANVWRLRILAVLILLHKWLEWVSMDFQHQIVLQQYSFPSDSKNVFFTEVDYPMLIILILAILVIAELVRSGAQLKAEQDLTV